MKCNVCGTELDSSLSRLVIDYQGKLVYLDGKEVALTKQEYELLEWFVLHPGQCYSRRELLGHVWGNKEVKDATVIEHIRRIRSKIGREFIETRKAYGYTWIDLKA